MNIEKYDKLYSIFILLSYKLGKLGGIIILCGIPFYLFRQYLIISIIVLLGLTFLMLAGVADLIAIYFKCKLDKCYKK